MTISDALFAIEEGFWLQGAEFFRDHIDSEAMLIFPQAGEMFGVKSREAIALTATSGNRWKDLSMQRRQCLMLSDGVAMIAYHANVRRADGVPYQALIGSVYVLRDKGWKLASHQHSPVIDEKTE